MNSLGNTSVKTSGDEVHDSKSSQTEEVTVPIHMVDYKPENLSQGENYLREQQLVLQVPLTTLQPSSSQEFVQIKMPPLPPPPPPRFHKKVNFIVDATSPETCSSKNKSLKKSLLPKSSFKNKNTISPGSASSPQAKSSITRSWSLTKMFTKMTTPTLPFTTAAHTDPEPRLSRAGGSLNLQTKVRDHIYRSQSVPILNENPQYYKRMDSFFRVIPTPSRTKAYDDMTPTPIPTDDDADGDDIAEEEAVCRICLDELCEGGETLKMECSCKGELALAHKECAIKWFSLKGNRTCDVCRQDVENLPVTLLRIQSTVRNRGETTTEEAHDHHVVVNAYSDIYRVWQETPILVIVSTLAYFCFLEEILVRKMRASSIALSLPFSCVLGLLSSMTTSAMVRRRFVWLYASFQFAFVVILTHIFKPVVKGQLIISILLGTFAGCGVTICGSSIVLEVMRLRRRWHSISNQRRDSPIEVAPPSPLLVMDSPSSISSPSPSPPPSYIASRNLFHLESPQHEAASSISPPPPPPPRTTLSRLHQP